MSDFPGTGRRTIAAAIVSTLTATTSAMGQTLKPQVLPSVSLNASGIATGPLSVRFDVNLNLSGLHPAATKGAIECGAVEQTRDWVAAHRSSLTDYASVQRWVLTQAHYFGQYALESFPISGRAYSGIQTFTTSISSQARLDPSTHSPYAPNPTVLIACWLSINGQPAVWDQGAGAQVVSVSNFTSVNTMPLTTAVADANAPITASALLSVHGTLFAPGPVRLSATLQVQGPLSTGGGSKTGSLRAGSTPAPGLSGSVGLGGSSGQAPVASSALPTAAGSSASGIPQLNVPNTGVGSTVPVGRAPSGAVPGTQQLITAVPPVAGISAVSTNPAAHTVFWSCAAGELSCLPSDPAAGAPTYSYEVWIRDPAATAFTLLSSSAQPVQGCSDPNSPLCVDPTTLKVDVARFLAPQTAFRVIRKDPGGAQSMGEFVYALPAQPVQPAGLTATEPQFGQVALSWQPVTGAVAYLIYEKGVNAPPARVTGTSTAWKAVAAGSHTYQVATEYTPGHVSTNMPEASVLVHAVPPARSVGYLTRNNGSGSASLSNLHQSANGMVDANGAASLSLLLVASRSGVLTGWDNNGLPTWRSPVAMAFYGNATELGFSRSVGCWQWPNTIGPVTVGMVTFCLAGNHGAPPGPQLPDANALAAGTGGAGQSYGLIVTSPTSGQFFANYVPDHSQGPGVTPLQLSNVSWGVDWKSSPTTTLDSEGPKYTPNACLTCHGGTVSSTTGKVTGASLLPIDPGLVVFPGNRAAQEESIRQINAMIAASMPSAAISDYVNGLYNGKVAVPGSTAQANYVPAAWSQQAQLFQAVVKSDCLMCHLATPAARNFGSAANFIQNKALIYADVCNAHSMPNAEVPYLRFWTSTGALGSTSVNLAGYMMAILGYNSCP